MHIELLWVIPIISFAVFLFIVAYQAQKSADRRSKTSVLSKEVALFNAGQELPGGVARTERNFDRLQELEKAINLVTEVLSCQGHQAQEPSSGAAGTQAPGSDDVNELKEKLRSVFKEYDIILSENYTLRAKVKQLSRHIKEKEAPVETPESPRDPVPTAAEPEPVTSRSATNLYDDTRLISLATLSEQRKVDPLKPASSV
ncbi:MAG: hypothetical protein JXA71_05140 [Chitinispirillaceae bacterium]|nr:hypothetical protein [Chitinispirillaceae bacterium]